jgi:hypothetical protein
MDVLSKLLMSIDAIRTQLSKSARKHADDYYHIVSAIDDYTLKLNNGGMCSFFELKGFAYILTDRERKIICEKIERSLDGFLPKTGYTIQIVDFADPEMTKTFLRESMASSFDELKNMGLDHAVFTEDYLDFASKISIWKKQYLIIQTSPSVLKGEKKAKTKDEEKEALATKSHIVEKIIKGNVNSQTVFSTPIEKQVFRKHRTFAKSIESEFTNLGALLKKMTVSKAVKSQKLALYGKKVSPKWEPRFDYISQVKASSDNDAPGKTYVDIPSMVEQVIHEGGTEEGLPPNVLSFAGRLFTTVSMVIPQEQEGNLKPYKYIASRVPRSLGYMCSFRMVSDPYSFSSYNVETTYAGLSSLLPMTDNLMIRRSRSAIRDEHESGAKTSTYMQMTVTLFACDEETLADNKATMESILDGWNRAKFRTVEMDKTIGLFDTLPGVTKESSLKQVMENFAEALYQSPLFMDGVIYDGGYLHFFTEDGQPFPFEEHASLNINYNVYICGTPGSGKSVLLTLLNLALLAKPKVNPKLKGEFPLMFDTDFGRTSFGMKKLLRRLCKKEKKGTFLLHDMTTGVESSMNPHDLILGRTSPTEFQKEGLVRFLHILLAGVEKSKDGNFKILTPEMESMIKYMIDVVYDYRKEDSTPRVFNEGEFKEKSTMAFMVKHGIKPNPNYSYYSLADLCMKACKRIGYVHAIVLRRYAVPRLGDYAAVLANNPELGARYEGTVVAGTSLKSYFVQRIGEVMNEFQCFTRPTCIPIDLARMISIDIDSVCGNSDYRKAVFGSMCLMMFLIKRQNKERSTDLFNDVDPIYIPYLEKFDEMNRVLPGVFNIEEAHILFKLFDDIMCSIQRRNRKEGWGIRSLSQNLIDPSDDFFSMTSTVFVYSEQTGEKVDARTRAMQCSSEEKRIIAEDINNRKAFVYIKTKPSSEYNVKRLAAKLDVKISPGWLWASNSEKVDENFLSEAMDKLGDDEGFSRVTRFFTKGSVRGYFESAPLKELAERRSLGSVFELLMLELTTRKSPSEELSHWL